MRRSLVASIGATCIVFVALGLAGSARADLAPSLSAPAPRTPPPEPTCGSPEWDALQASVAAYCAVEPARDPDAGGRRRLERACRHIERAFRRCATDGDPLSLDSNDEGLSGTVRDPARGSFAWRIRWSGPRRRPHVSQIRYEYDDCDCC